MRPSSQESIAFYDREALSYDQKRWRTAAGRYVDETQRGIVRALVGSCAGRTALDVATGTGRFAIELARQGASVTALDSSLAMLEICTTKAVRGGVSHKLTTIQGTASSLPFPDATFDVCVCINALNHIPDQPAVLQELSRVVRQGGLLVTNYTNWQSWFLPAGLLVRLRSRSVREDVYTTWFSYREIKALHHGAGLRIDRVAGAVQVPGALSGPVPFFLLRQLDRLSRDTVLRRLAPQLFVRAWKVNGPV